MAFFLSFFLEVGHRADAILIFLPQERKGPFPFFFQYSFRQARHDFSPFFPPSMLFRRTGVFPLSSLLVGKGHRPFSSR